MPFIHVLDFTDCKANIEIIIHFLLKLASLNDDMNELFAFLGRARLHLALVNNTHITFGSIRPELNFEKTLFNVIKLISYLKQVVCEDGYRIKRLLIESKTNSHYSRYSADILPKLPKKAEKSIQNKTAYTPRKKRIILHEEFM